MNLYEKAKQNVKQVSKDRAINFVNTKTYADLTDIGKFKFQIMQDRLCMDFSEFQRVTEVALGRGVWTHEFAKPELLWEEYLGVRETPTDPFSTFYEVMR